MLELEVPDVLSESKYGTGEGVLSVESGIGNSASDDDTSKSDVDAKESDIEESEDNWKSLFTVVGIGRASPGSVIENR